ncbi:hypothetical protein P154DRAFT_574145, partial [Amniculicola lignicola CBS 123094]
TLSICTGLSAQPFTDTFINATTSFLVTAFTFPAGKAPPGVHRLGVYKLHKWTVQDLRGDGGLADVGGFAGTGDPAKRAVERFIDFDQGKGSPGISLEMCENGLLGDKAMEEQGSSKSENLCRSGEEILVIGWGFKEEGVRFGVEVGGEGELDVVG